MYTKLSAENDYGVKHTKHIQVEKNIMSDSASDKTSINNIETERKEFVVVSKDGHFLFDIAMQHLYHFLGGSLQHTNDVVQFHQRFVADYFMMTTATR